MENFDARFSKIQITVYEKMRNQLSKLSVSEIKPHLIDFDNNELDNFCRYVEALKYECYEILQASKEIKEERNNS